MAGVTKGIAICEGKTKNSSTRFLNEPRATIWACMLLVFICLVSCREEKGNYVCKPCDLPCDELTFEEPGICPHCTMDLIERGDLVPEKPMVLNQIELEPGSGKLLIEGGLKKEKTIVVHYHMPSTFERDSKVLFVLPGAGRNGDDYRDAWIANSEKYNVLVLSLEYSENHYPGFWNYNLGGMFTDVNVQERTFKANNNEEQWIYSDFDRIFDKVRKALSLTTNDYDMFGHSAGGQLVHRLVIFKPNNKANRILASNSGWYTVPTDEEIFPYGLRDMTITKEALKASYTSRLILFLGEEDNAEETRGSLRRSPEADKQGLHRLARGIYFYEESIKNAERQNFSFNWKLEILPGIGHDYERMSQAAAEFLYASPR